MTLFKPYSRRVGVAAAMAIAIGGVSMVASTASAQAPTILPLQGKLADAAGVPINAALDVTFSLYTDSVGSNLIWTETQTIAFDGGVFTAYLGSVSPIDTSAFRDNTSIFLGVQVGVDDEMPLHQLGSRPFAGYADYCGEAGQLEGRDFSDVTTDVLASVAGEGYLTSYTETDPNFAASDAAAVTASGIANWNSAYSWGDHSGPGYLTSYTETDSVFGASDASAVTAAGMADWNTAFSWGDHAIEGYLTTESDPTFAASDSSGISAADITNWDVAANVVNGGLEILGRSDSRLAFVGAWNDSGGWGENRLSNLSSYTTCLGVDTDCSADNIVVTLTNNRHRALSMAHLNWSNSDLISVYINVDGGGETLLRTIATTNPFVNSVNDYHSTMHMLAGNLPLGSDVVIRVEATEGRVHFEGMALSQNPLPITLAPRTAQHGIPASNAWTAVSGLSYDFTLDRPTVVDFDYSLTGNNALTRYLLCRMRVVRPDWTWLPREGRSIVGNTVYFSVQGQVSGALAAGDYTARVECRTPNVVTSDPGTTDWQDRYFRLRFPSH